MNNLREAYEATANKKLVAYNPNGIKPQRYLVQLGNQLRVYFNNKNEFNEHLLRFVFKNSMELEKENRFIQIVRDESKVLFDIVESYDTEQKAIRMAFKNKTDSFVDLHENEVYKIIIDEDGVEVKSISELNSEKEVEDNYKLGIERVIGDMDWNLLRQQKDTLFKLLDTDAIMFINQKMNAVNNVEGLISFLNHVQDIAVDELGLDENDVFSLEEYEPETIEIDTSNSYVVMNEDGDMMFSIKSGSSFNDRLLRALQSEFDKDIRVDLITYVGKTYNLKFTMIQYDNPDFEISSLITLTPTYIY